MAENAAVEIPKELEILNPEWQKKPILIGIKAYMLYPLTEVQAEKLSKVLGDILYEVYTTDCQCPKCGRVYTDALGKIEVCPQEKCKGERLEELQVRAVEAVLKRGRIRSLLGELLSIPEVEVRRATIPPLRYIAGIIFIQNFDEESTLPEGAEKNFERLLEWMGLGTMPREPVSEKSMKLSPASTDSQENISRENGRTEGSGDSPGPSSTTIG